MSKTNKPRSRNSRFLVAVLVVLLACVLPPSATLAQPIEWTRQAFTGPSARIRSAMAYDTARGVTVLFGGNANGLDGETWEWNGTVWNLRSTTGPAPRQGHAMVYDVARGVTVMYGGWVNNAYLGQTWEWDGTTWTQRVVNGSPAPRGYHAMAYDTARGVTVLFGGLTEWGPIADTWEWNGTAWSYCQSTNGAAPGGRIYAAMAYDSARGVTVHFGGGDSVRGETWEWNGTNWTLRSSSGPSPRYFHAMAYDSMRGVTILFGGNEFCCAIGETWEWNGLVWVQRSAIWPSARYSHAMAYDSARGVAVLFGGENQLGILAETWELCVAGAITRQPGTQAACTTGTAIFAITACGTAPVAYQWRKDTIAIDTLANPSAATATLTLTSVGPADVASYDCIVTNAWRSVTSNPAALTLAVRCSVADIVGTDGGSVQCGDSTVDGSDFIAFINSFGIGDTTLNPLADVAGGGDDGLEPDGTIDGSDFIAFINAFALGC